jgi:hypothetical protein
VIGTTAEWSDENSTRAGFRAVLVALETDLGRKIPPAVDNSSWARETSSLPESAAIGFIGTMALLSLALMRIINRTRP